MPSCATLLSLSIDGLTKMNKIVTWFSNETVSQRRYSWRITGAQIYIALKALSLSDAHNNFVRKALLPFPSTPFYCGRKRLRDNNWLAEHHTISIFPLFKWYLFLNWNYSGKKFSCRFLRRKKKIFSFCVAWGQGGTSWKWRTVKE